MSLLKISISILKNEYFLIEVFMEIIIILIVGLFKFHGNLYNFWLSNELTVC